MAYFRGVSNLSEITKKRNEPNDELTFSIGIMDYNFDTIINKEIKGEFRPEAKQIIKYWLKRMRDKDRLHMQSDMIELVIYHLENTPVFATHLEYMKSKLLKWGYEFETEHFNGIFTND